MWIYLWADTWPLCFTANTASSTVTLGIWYWSPAAVSLETSTDGSNWSSYTIWDTITLSNIGDKVYFRNTSETDTWFSTSVFNYYKFTMTWSIAWSWDVTSLLNKNCTNTLSDYCFTYLFDQCSSLTKTPELPATNLATNCYLRMFRGCTSLTEVSDLPATAMANSCYYSMFEWCTALTTISSLPATTMANSCYYSMFQWCTALTTLPKLPATTLADSCYWGMFRNCTNIKLSTTQTWAYQTPYRIPTTWTGTDWWSSLTIMFTSTWWSWTWTPTINTTYYTSNTVI